MMEKKDFHRCLTGGNDGTYIDISASPGSSHDSIQGFNPWRERLKVTVKEAPTGGKANDSIIDLLSNIFDVDPGSIKITKGARSKKKRLLILGVEKDRAERKISEHIKG